MSTKEGSPVKEVCELIQYFHKQCLAQVASYRQKIMERIAVTQLIRKMLLDMSRQVYAQIKQIEDNRANPPS